MQISMSMAEMERSAGVLVGQAYGEAMARALRRTPWTGMSGATLPVLPRFTWWGCGTSISARIAVLTAQGAVLTRPVAASPDGPTGQPVPQ